jgi:all-trans-8'-apo-beta-carotenal 15,15'-oxygenase
MVFDARRGTSGLAIFDARNVAGGPLARLHLRDTVPYGLHGQFVAK